MRYEDVLGLLALGEQEWIEVKESLADVRKIGETISAVGNAAMLNDQPHGWVIWGFEDETRACVGTVFSPDTLRHGGEAFRLHLQRMLHPRVLLEWRELRSPEGQRIVVLRVPVPEGQPLAFAGSRRCRVGPHNQRLEEHPQLEAKLFSLLSLERAEGREVHSRVHEDELGTLLDLPGAAGLLEVGTESVVDTLVQCEALVRVQPGSYAVTAMALLVFGRDLRSEPRLQRHAPRVVIYDGTDRRVARREIGGARGFALGFEGLLRTVMSSVPATEVYRHGRRESDPLIPELAVREILVNALIHQDLHEQGTGPLIEIFADRLEVSNPGKPLINDVRRLLDLAPQSRNEGLATLMRRMRFAEERGSGIDKVVIEMEEAHLPAPIFEVSDNRTRVTLWGPRTFEQTPQPDRLVTVYFHACIRWLDGRQPIRNQSVRERFGLDVSQTPVVSRLLSRAVEMGWIKTYAEGGSGRSSTYVPFWAR